VSGFEERFDHPLKPNSDLPLYPWLHKLDDLIEKVQNNEMKIWIEVFEAPNITYNMPFPVLFGNRR
jgi:hypothetical protein